MASAGKYVSPLPMNTCEAMQGVDMEIRGGVRMSFHRWQSTIVDAIA